MINAKKLMFAITPSKAIVLGYLFFDIIATILLILPFSLNPGVDLKFIDALFTATSAISVTGLNVVNTYETFDSSGRIILVILLQFGGIGIMTLGTLIYVIRGTKINLLARMMISSDQNQTSLSGMFKLMLFILKFAVILELIGSIMLTAYFMIYKYMPFGKAFEFGVFHSISGFTNAGFDLFGNSLQGFDRDYFIQGVLFVLLLAGGIGFPVLIEVFYFLKSLLKKERFLFSLFTKVTTVTFLILLISGSLVMIFSESSNAFAGMTWQEKTISGLFHSLNTRNGGFSTINFGILNSTTLLFFSLLMFIGASPSSCGGGIRTTTLAVVFLSMISSFRGRNEVRVFEREIYQEDINKAFNVFFIALMLVGSSIFLLTIFEPFSINELIFEACSAFGTTGLSMGITAELSTWGKLILILLMFIGRIGIISLLLLFRGRLPSPRYHLVKERIIIG